MSIRLFSGTTEPGGSTVAHINLINLFNKHGIEAYLYGPHDWHLDKCQGLQISCDINARIKELCKPNDIVITHFLHPSSMYCIPRKRHILSLHEKHLFPLKKYYNRQNYDKVHFVSETQKDWHEVSCPHFICHPLLDPSLKKSQVKPENKVAGIIGNIDRNKRTHLSIQRALDDGHSIIKLFGKYIQKDGYYEESILPFIELHPEKISMQFSEDKQSMYDSLTDVYLSSSSETWSFIKAECEVTNTTFHGTPEIEKNFPKPLLSEDEIFNIWKKELGL